MSAVEKAAPVMTLPEIGQPFGGGFFSGITRDPDTGKRYLNINAKAICGPGTEANSRGAR